MGHTTINRERAQVLALSARFAAIAMALCCGAVVVFGVPGAGTRLSEPSATPTPDAVPADPQPVPRAAARVDAGGIATRLASVSNAPKPVVTAREVEPEDFGELAYEHETVTVNDEVGFLGLIREPGRVLALMRIGGRQAIMWPGREVDGVSIAEIGDDHVQVERGGTRWRVDRSQRKQSTVSRIDVPLLPPTPVSDMSVSDHQSREAAINALRQNRMQGRDRARPINVAPGQQGFRMNDPGRQWRED
ncbi:MAG: hypothetical protein KF912_04865 [Phycisphaeraceae bacterium]|nr:hypothetical protein [Phycisphaeraceae bacterium]MBX3366629.1 hypothetical protein [Phycisphaeraceae bacterium]